MREHFALALVLEHLGRDPCDQPALADALAWPRERIAALVAQLDARRLIEREAETLKPTQAGEEFVRSIVDRFKDVPYISWDLRDGPGHKSTIAPWRA